MMNSQWMFMELNLHVVHCIVIICMHICPLCEIKKLFKDKDYIPSIFVYPTVCIHVGTE